MEWAAISRYASSCLAVLVVEGLRVDRRHCGVHAPQPGVALDEPDLERAVPHPQAGVAALVGVGARAAPVLLEEHPQPHLGGVEVLLGVQRAQDLVLADQRVEPRHDGVEGVVATHFVVEGPLRLSHVTHCSDLPELPDLRCRLVTSCEVHPGDLQTRSEFVMRWTQIHGGLSGGGRMAHRKKAAATGIPGSRRAYPGWRTPRRCCTASKLVPHPRRLDLGPSPRTAPELHL